MRVLLLSAYAAASHQYWARSLQQMCPDWDWQLLELPPRHFAWRVRGNPLLWLSRQRHHLSREWDLVVATSMVDLATLRGLVPSLATTPCVLYCHENQFDYPDNQSRHGVLEAQMVSVYAALAASVLVFNSGYNRDTFFSGLESLFRRLPDQLPASLVENLASKSRVLPVPVEDVSFAVTTAREDPVLQILWHHRWEYDKGPERLLAAVQKLDEIGVSFQLNIAGQRFRKVPASLGRLADEFSHCIRQWGFVSDREQYLALLGRCHLALSTALHDFQGLAMQEAAAAGCRILVPDRLAYPEFFPRECRYPSSLQDPEAEAAVLADYIAAGQGATANVTALASRHLTPLYRELLQSTAAG